MDEKKIYRQKIEARLVVAHAYSKLSDLKALIKDFPEDKAVKFSNEIEELEKNLRDANFKLDELNEGGDYAWEHFKESAGDVWSALKASVRNVSARYKELC